MQFLLSTKSLKYFGLSRTGLDDGFCSSYHFLIDKKIKLENKKLSHQLECPPVEVDLSINNITDTSMKDFLNDVQKTRSLIV